jgi:hypothetical protein
MFLYFLELMGLKNDKGDLSWYCQVIAKNGGTAQEEKKLRDLFKDEFEVSFEKLVFFNLDKEAVE